MKLKVGDEVQIIAGKDKGKKGKIIRIFRKQNKIVVEKINMRTKHIKKTTSQAGDKIEFEGPIDASNAMILDPRSGKPSRIGYRILENGKKERIAKKSGDSLDTITKSK